MGRIPSSAEAEKRTRGTWAPRQVCGGELWARRVGVKPGFRGPGRWRMDPGLREDSESGKEKSDSEEGIERGVVRGAVLRKGKRRWVGGWR